MDRAIPPISPGLLQDIVGFLIHVNDHGILWVEDRPKGEAKVVADVCKEIELWNPKGGQAKNTRQTSADEGAAPPGWNGWKAIHHVA